MGRKPVKNRMFTMGEAKDLRWFKDRQRRLIRDQIRVAKGISRIERTALVRLAKAACGTFWKEEKIDRTCFYHVESADDLTVVLFVVTNITEGTHESIVPWHVERRALNVSVLHNCRRSSYKEFKRALAACEEQMRFIVKDKIQALNIYHLTHRKRGLYAGNAYGRTEVNAPTGETAP